jgi:hypothetical protein
MTECNGQSVVFSSLRRQKVEADWNGGLLTSDAGTLLLREVDRRIGLIDALSRCIPDPRNPHFIVHDQRTLLAQRIFGIALGYEDLNDQQSLREDPLFQVVTERGVKQVVTEDGVKKSLPLGSPPTLCRLENRVGREAAFLMNAAFVELFVRSHATPPEELVLDFDATDDLVHGNQEGRHRSGYYDNYCFLPLYVFCGTQLLVAYLRPANIDAAKHSWAILKLLVTRLRRAWPEVKITLRGDSGFCRWKMMQWCDRHGVHYILGEAKNAVLLRKADSWIEQAKAAFAATHEKQRLFGEIQYAAETWDQPRRVIVKAEHWAEGPNTRFVVTNHSGDPQELYDRGYCARGEMENRIKEQQLGLFADRTSCHRFLANQFRMLLSAAAYVLVETLRRVGLQGTELAGAQVTTIRLKLLKIGARVVTSVRRIVLHLAGGYPLKALFARIALRLRVSVPVLTDPAPE